MTAYLPAIIMAFREGLEGFLIVIVLFKFLDKTGNSNLKKQVWNGTVAGVVFSLVVGFLLLKISGYIGGLKIVAKLWESIAGFIAVALVTTFIFWMIQNGSKIKDYLENKVSENLSKKGMFLLVLFMISREGTEIAIFSFAGKYEALPVVIGLSLALLLVILIHFALVKVNLKIIFMVTLAYLVLQAGYLLGYSIHEGLSAAKSLGWIEEGNAIFNKAYNLYETSLNHKKGIFGLPLNVFFGWYSKPEWIQFIIQYSYTLLLIGYWMKTQKKTV